MDRRRHWIVILCCLGMVGVVAATLGPDFLPALRSRLWQPVPCTIVTSTVEEEQTRPDVTHYILRVEYTYSFGGRDYRGTRYRTGRFQGSTNPEVTEAAARRLAAGAQATCYVNPRQPAEAVLERGELWGAIFLFAPLLIAGLILHEPIFEWLGRRRLQARTRIDAPVSDTNDALRTDGRMVLFGALGGVMGLFFMGFCIVTPLHQWSRSRNWIETDAVIDRCALSSRSGLHGPEYSLDLLYSYEFKGQRHRSSRRGFSGNFDEPVADTEAWISAHPPGTRIRCFVNPEDPSEAILERRLGIGWVSLALGLLMLGFGAANFWQLARARRLRRLSGAALADHCIGRYDIEPAELQVRPSPALLAAGALAAAPILATAGLWSLVKGGRALIQGHTDMINLLYGAGAVIAAGWLIKVAFEAWQLSRRPLPVLRVTPGTPRVDGSFHAEWNLKGEPDPDTTFSLWLEGVEYARIRHTIEGHHGPISEEKTTEENFARIPLAQHGPGEGHSGQLTATVPARAMHSFNGEKCGVRWRLKVELSRNGEKPLEFKFPIRILPSEPSP